MSSSTSHTPTPCTSWAVERTINGGSTVLRLGTVRWTGEGYRFVPAVAGRRPSLKSHGTLEGSLPRWVGYPSRCETRRLEGNRADSRAIEAKDIANAAMGRSAVRKIEVLRMPPTRAGMCAACPFRPGIDAFTALKCEVLKDELRAHPNAVWMCHETAGGGAEPTAKSIICKGAVDWRAGEALLSSLSQGEG